MNKVSKILLVYLTIIFSSLSYSDDNIGNDITVITDEINQQIDINLADVKTLSSLKGVGKKKAEAIIKYRDENGRFSSVDDLLNVNGIGKQVLTMNKAKLII